MNFSAVVVRACLLRADDRLFRVVGVVLFDIVVRPYVQVVEAPDVDRLVYAFVLSAVVAAVGYGS